MSSHQRREVCAGICMNIPFNPQIHKPVESLNPFSPASGADTHCVLLDAVHHWCYRDWIQSAG